MKLEFWKLRVTVGIENKGIGPYGVLNQPDQPTQFGHFSDLDPPLSVMRLPRHKDVQCDVESLRLLQVLVSSVQLLLNRWL
jgi:hypothetical protein